MKHQGVPFRRRSTLGACWGWGLKGILQCEIGSRGFELHAARAGENAAISARASSNPTPTPFVERRTGGLGESPRSSMRQAPLWAWITIRLHVRERAESKGWVSPAMRGNPPCTCWGRGYTPRAPDFPLVAGKGEYERYRPFQGHLPPNVLRFHLGTPHLQRARRF